MVARLTATQAKKQLTKCQDWGDYLDLTRILFNQGSISLARDVSVAAIERFGNMFQCFYDNLGVCEWLLNDPQKAIESWRGALRTSYGDSSGHMRTKLLLWFSGVMRDDERVRNEAVTLLERAIGTLRGKHWPGAIARYILGKSSEEEVTAAAKVVDQLHNLDRERRLALLYFGAMAYAARDINRAVFCFSQCADDVVAALDESFMHELRLAAFERDRLVGNSSRGEKVVVNTASKARTKKRSNVRKKGAR